MKVCLIPEGARERLRGWWSRHPLLLSWLCLGISCGILCPAAHAQSSGTDIATATIRKTLSERETAGPSDTGRQNGAAGKDKSEIDRSAFAFLRDGKTDLGLALPLSWTSNAIPSGSDAGVSGKGDFHANPELYAKWSKQFSSVKINAKGAISSDRYLASPDAELAVSSVALKGTLTDGKSDLFEPYAVYQYSREYSRDLRERLGTYREAAVGFSSGIGFDAKGKLIAASDANENGSTAIVLDASTGRRTADRLSATADFMQIGVEASYTLNKFWTLSANPSLRVRWYESYHDEFRRDIRLGAGLKAVWTPDWLTKYVPRGEIAFNAVYLRTMSNISGKTQSGWDIGPSILIAKRL